MRDPDLMPDALDAVDDFLDVEFSDSRNVKRLLQIRDAVHVRPHGKVTAVFTQQAAQQATFDFLENSRTPSAQVAASVFRASARRAAAFPLVVEADDGTSLHLTDPARSKGTGPIGTRRGGARGFKVLSSVLFTPRGACLGLVAQLWWARPNRKSPVHRNRLPFTQKELGHWLTMRHASRALLAQHAPDTVVFRQSDRETDAWPILLDAVVPRPNEAVTVRASWDRRLDATAEAAPEEKHLWAKLEAAPVRGRTTLKVKKGEHRQAREAVLAVRWVEVTLALRDKQTGRAFTATLTAVLTQEEGTTPPGEKPIEWMLLTTWPVENLVDACWVLFAYSLRWGIEEFHHTWKSGRCQVEATQLRTLERVRKWGTILAAEATRAMRLTKEARETPEKPASEEFDAYELEALKDLRRVPAEERGKEVTLGEAVQWIAELGGYTGKSSGGPPGRIVIGRGLLLVDAAALAYRNRAELQAQARLPPGRSPPKPPPR